MDSWLRYANQGATRNQPLSDELVNALNFLGPMGVQMEVFSGGQPGSGPGRVGSHRHDYGNAADVMFSQGGRRLDWSNPADISLYQDIVKQARARGVTGFGAGPGYMRPGSMHIGYGPAAVWGAGGSGANAPAWLREAAGSGGKAPPEANLSTTPQTASISPQPVANWGMGGMPSMATNAAPVAAQTAGNDAWLRDLKLQNFGMDDLVRGVLSGQDWSRALVYNTIGSLFS